MVHLTKREREKHQLPATGNLRIPISWWCFTVKTILIQLTYTNDELIYTFVPKTIQSLDAIIKLEVFGVTTGFI